MKLQKCYELETPSSLILELQIRVAITSDIPGVLIPFEKCVECGQETTNQFSLL